MLDDRLTDEELNELMHWAGTTTMNMNIALNLGRVFGELLAARARIAALEAENAARPNPCRNVCMLIRLNRAQGDED